MLVPRPERVFVRNRRLRVEGLPTHTLPKGPYASPLLEGSRVRWVGLGSGLGIVLGFAARPYYQLLFIDTLLGGLQ